jgi:hypothetical protein
MVLLKVSVGRLVGDGLVRVKHLGLAVVAVINSGGQVAFGILDVSGKPLSV